MSIFQEQTKNYQWIGSGQGWVGSGNTATKYQGIWVPVQYTGKQCLTFGFQLAAATAAAAAEATEEIAAGQQATQAEAGLDIQANKLYVPAVS